MAKQLRMTVIGDSSSAQRALTGLQSQASKFTGSLAGVGASNRRNPWSGLAAAMSGSGLLGQFAELQGAISGVSSGLDHLGGKKKINVGATLTGVGVAGAALGGVAEQLSSPLEAARAQLRQSISNVGGDFSKAQKPISDNEKRMQRLGFTYTQTDTALSKLTSALGSPQKAMAELGLTADIAARNHTDLSTASDLVIRSYAGSTRALKLFGINVQANTAAGKAAVKAQKDQKTAADNLQKAQQRLSQVQARLVESQGTKGASAQRQQAANAKGVAAAQTEVAAAGQHLQDVEAKLQAGTLKGASAQSALEQAQNRVAAANQKLNDAQAKSVTVAGLSVSQQQELANAQQAVADAQGKKSAADQQAAKTAGDLNKTNLTGDQILTLLHQKTKGLAEAQAQTFGGDLRKWKASVIDFGATWGEKFAKPLITIGPALAGVGALMESGFFGKIGKGITGLTRGVAGLGRGIGGLVGIVSPKTVPTVAEAPAAGGLPARDAAGRFTTSGEEGLTTAAEQLQGAGTELQSAARQLTGAASDEAGAATALDTSATGLDSSGTALDASATGLDTSGAAIDTAGVGLDASGTALDTSATALDASATALDGAAAAGGARGALGGGLAGKVGIAGAAGLLAYQGTSSVLKHNLFGTGTAVTSAATGVENFLGVHVGPSPTATLGGGSVAFLESIASGTTTNTRISKSDARSQLHNLGIQGYAGGGYVPARPGGTLVNVAEAGQGEIIGSAGTIVGALEAALVGAGAGGRSGPDVAHYHQGVTVTGPVTIQANDVGSMMRQLQELERRANFSGEGLPGRGDL